MNKKVNLKAWALMLPALSLLIAFTHWPTLKSVFRSVTWAKSDMAPSQFVGLENYAMMLDDPVFWKVMENNLWYAIGTVPTSIALAIIMALWVNSKMRFTGLLRLAFFTPTILPMITVANIWLFFYSPNIGLFDQLLQMVNIDGPNWLGDPDLALPSLIFMTVWKEAGFFMIFYLAALQLLSVELYEAAKVEGASAWCIFRKITFPLLMPTTLFVLINALLNAFKLVDHLFILTKGGPNNASNLLLYYIYETAFSFLDSYYAATLTVVMLVMLAIIAFVQIFIFDRKIHYR
ncbi:MAG: sugar ABC transporter permease [Gammaproteobacteria bacterium]|jgi:sn-glycerol 3-phosphate transport system permease protein|nr:sugar ABC transporter permease [Gammaproteobacteria bacterium]MCP4927550.1 sugar ABC transporter permease [Gammaproteobacteria bacterium]MDP6165558.1 sugar ABC transporter permease [Gammaproteobacteria bacterium]